jgi:integrase
VKKSAKKRARYGSGNLWLRGRIWWIRYREIDQRAKDKKHRYVHHCESTGSEDREYAQRVLNARLTAQGGRRPTETDPKKVTYENVRDNFLERCIEKGRRSLKRVGEEMHSLDTIPRLNQAFSGWRVTDLTTNHVRRFRLQGKQEGLSDARLNRYIATLRAMFKQAAKDELITAAEMPAYFPMVHEPNEARGAVYIKDEWYRPLRRQLPAQLRNAFTLAYHTGIRVGEMQRLRWKHFGFKKMSGGKGIIHLTGDITKTGEQRDIWIPLEFDLKLGKADDLVFPVLSGDYRRPWRRACIKVGAGRWEEMASGRKRYVGAQLRHCRHTACRNMSDQGNDRDRIRQISGHKTDSMFSRYNIGREEDVLNMARTMSHRKGP